MRRAIVSAVVVLILAAGGCWIANDRTQQDGQPPDGAPLDEAGEDLDEQEPVSGAPELDEPLPEAQTPNFEAFDLLRNRPLGHRTTHDLQGRSVWVVGGGFDFVRYVLGNHHSDWYLNSEVRDGDDEPVEVAAVRGTDGTLGMPAFAGDAEVLEARVFNPADHNELTLRVEGRTVESRELEEGFQTVAFDLAELPVGDDNEVRLEFSNLGRIEGRLSGGGVDWMRIGPEESEADGPHELIADQQGTLNLEAGTGLTWMVWMHADASVQLEIEAEPGCGPNLEVGVEDGEGGVEVAGRRAIELVEGRGDVQTTAVDVDIDHSRVARLDLGLAADRECESVEIADASLVRPGSVEGVPGDFEPPEYVVVWLIDTLRADYLPIHFETDVQAPNLVELAEGGVSFETAYVQGTESRASHASLFTGDYPDRHGVMTGGTVDPRQPILSHMFQNEGFETAAMVANGYVSHLLNLDRGWDLFRNYIHEELAVDAWTLLEDGLDWIEGRDGEFFWYAGTVDPHATYRAHDEFIELYEPAGYQGRFRSQLTGELLGDIKAGAETLTEREKERTVNLYKNEITYNDDAFGRLREVLEDKGVWEDTLVVVTSDHGEEFWEHGSVGHGHSVYQEMVHVPLMFHYPRELPEGRTVRSGGEVVDVVPTIREMLGAEGFDDRQGWSLLPAIFGEHGGYPAPAIATQYQLEYGLEIRNWKLILDSGGVELFDRDADPLEQNDVAGDHPVAGRWLQDTAGWFRAHSEDWEKERWGVANNVSGEFLELIEEE